MLSTVEHYYREAMFNTLLTERAMSFSTSIIVDLRIWTRLATDVYDFLGGLDLQDHLDGIDFIVKNYALTQARWNVWRKLRRIHGRNGSNACPGILPVQRAASRADWKNYYLPLHLYG